MSNIDDGGLAFPSELFEQPGMTLRDYFAAAALSVALDNWKSFNARQEDDEEPSIDLVAREAYDIADAMLTARKEEA
jgi:BMFP domain-containing protein YqiC